ncbi:MAG: hypothetical protein WC824_05755 [Bacteroidota bacterium]|jgi:hypothetical protein
MAYDPGLSMPGETPFVDLTGGTSSSTVTTTENIASSPQTATVEVDPKSQGFYLSPTMLADQIATAAVSGVRSSSSVNREALTALSVSNPPPPNAFRELTLGPTTTIEVTPNQQSPVDGSDAYIRGLSPFVIQVELPLVFGQDGGFTNQTSNNVNINTFANANGAVDLYANARSSVAASGIGTLALRNLGIPANPSPTVGQTNKAPDGANVSDTGQGSSRLGFPAIADQNVAMDIATQLATALNAPPLVLLINPHTMSMSLTKVQSFQDRTRYGYIYHIWGEEQPKLSINTKCGAFISGGRGVQFASKQDSASWQNLMNLFRFYKHNGYIHDTIGKSNAHHFVGALSITYDGWIYYGHMESFSWNFEETVQNGGIDFTLEFTVSRAVDTSSPVFAVTPMLSPVQSMSDPRYFGAANVGNDGPGTYALGKDGISTALRIIGSGVSSLVGGRTGTGLSKGVSGSSQTPTQPLGTQGFRPVSSGSSERTISQASPGDIKVFALG